MSAVILADSEAFRCLTRYAGDPETYKISIDVRGDGVALKRNEDLWTPTLKVTR